ncbi:cystathionine beta-lyase [Benzoatithermus flavus]|uniref:Cystathionine beta-lyase n=1 Tax=Benzoatithermus flavus TaxID=3108223 RepID=A0ABU8XRD0_9PROT
MNDATLVTMAGREPERHAGVVNPPVYHASTILFPTLDALEAARPDRGVYYGRYGTPTTFALEEAVARLEGGDRAIAVGSGKTAITATLLSLLKSGDHLLVTDSVYAPTRHFCSATLARFGIETSYYDPLIGGRIAELIRPNTKVVFTESPGSLTFEVQDIPAIAEAAHARGALVVMDNTWASPLYFKPFRHGVDISIQAATKYIGGHSDLMMGIVTCTEAAYERVWRGVMEVATVAAPDDCYLALRGLRTLSARLERHQRSAIEVAEWLRGRPEIAGVLHPALPGDPGHALWRRDFLGASGLFGFVLKPCPRTALAAMLDGMELFGMGYSWGGYESLLIPTHPETCRTAVPWRTDGVPMRIHVGLEDTKDLIADLEAGLNRLRRAAA